MTSTEGNGALRLRIAYGPLPSQFGELHLPASRARPGAQPSVCEGRLPVVAVLHGGWWKDNQSLRSYPTLHLVEWLARRGDVAVWNLEFRRMQAQGPNTAAPWPAVLQDVARGLDHLRVLADHHPIDLRRLTVVGHSAGAHLAAWSACRERLCPDSELFVADPLRPSQVVLLAGLLCLDRWWDMEQPQQVERLLGGPVERCEERLAQACPTRLGLPPGVSGLVMHGQADAVVSMEQALAFCERAGPAVALCLLPGADHFGMLPKDGLVPAGWPLLQQRLDGLLRRAGPG
ncbi:alpha/beta hydrolase [Pelomonas sp. CA6]|uniref:alpha/beta hydrolase n=1 Tax=Pelomonas sp. CA6 TaxID=2907999 RepID=UPI001F4C0E6F|nr:alpha/beta hydrolase [Pelomonas sp. CA6]MCH7345251.1 alpha/beta hydrolase [Pelomonas sp. CA6]